MIHFLPDPDVAHQVYAGDSFDRIVGLGHALAATESMNGQHSPRGHPTLGTAWPSASNARHALLDTLSSQAVTGSVAGLEALGAVRDAGLEANRAAVDTLAVSIRGELDRLGGLLTL